MRDISHIRLLVALTDVVEYIMNSGLYMESESVEALEKRIQLSSQLGDETDRDQLRESKRVLFEAKQYRITWAAATSEER